MDEQGVQLKVEQDADVTILTVLSTRVPASLSESFEETVVETVKTLENPKVLIDFSAVQFLSSAILGKLIMLNGRLADRQGQLRLCSLTDKIAEVFKITSLDRLFQIHKTRADALKAFV